MDAEILTVGDELLIGQVLDTNAARIGEQLSLLGVDVKRMVSLGDDVEDIRRELGHAYETAELVIVTGGLGPTHDDVTKVAIAEFFGAQMRFEESVFAEIRERFERRGLPMPESNRTQALVPEGFEVLHNPSGTAPGLWHAQRQDGRERLMVVLPGVPHEMETLLQQDVLPRLRALKGLRVIVHRTLLTTGIGESNLQDAVGDVSAYLGSSMRLAYLPGPSGVRLRMTAYGTTHADVEERLQAFEAHLYQQVGTYIYGRGDETLEGNLGARLRARGLTIAVAESCTGGLVQNRLTDIPGSSAYMLGGAVAYCNAIKQRVLGVEAKALEQHGAVSEQVAVQMAQGVRERFGANVGVSTTGIMGPTGGTPDKPVGTVWFGYADDHGSTAELIRFGGDRRRNKERACTAALNLVRRQLGDEPEGR